MKAYEIEIRTEGLIRGAAREPGRLVETGSYISNTSLYYALKISRSQYVDIEEKATYVEDTEGIKNIYIAPAKPVVDLNFSNFTNTVSGSSYVELNLPARHPDNKINKKNYPKLGTEKVLTCGNRFVTFLISPKDLELPTYFRLGKKRGKCKLEMKELRIQKKRGAFRLSHPIGAYDTELEPLGNLLTKNSRPTPLILQAEYNGPYYELSYDNGKKENLPGDLEFLKQKR